MLSQLDPGFEDTGYYVNLFPHLVAFLVTLARIMLCNTSTANCKLRWLRNVGHLHEGACITKPNIRKWNGTNNL